MAENSNIEWTHHTFNPWIGCTKVSPACDHCYAEAWNKRYDGGKNWGPHAPRRLTKTWGNPVKWNREAEKKGIRYRVFCASLADVFDNHKTILPEWRIALWGLIRATPHLDWLLLTKRPQNIEKYLPGDWGNGYANVWLGATVENQTEAERRIPHLLSVPAKIKFLSCEPLLGPLDLEYPEKVNPKQNCCGGGAFNECGCNGMPTNPPLLYGLDWIITGGESGTHFRPANPDWFRSLRDQCAAAGVSFLFKQWEGASQPIIKAKGRELDGVIHNGYPGEAA